MGNSCYKLFSKRTKLTSHAGPRVNNDDTENLLCSQGSLQDGEQQVGTFVRGKKKNKNKNNMSKQKKNEINKNILTGMLTYQA